MTASESDARLSNFCRETIKGTFDALIGEQHVPMEIVVTSLMRVMLTFAAQPCSIHSDYEVFPWVMVFHNTGTERSLSRQAQYSWDAIADTIDDLINEYGIVTAIIEGALMDIIVELNAAPPDAEPRTRRRPDLMVFHNLARPW